MGDGGAYADKSIKHINPKLIVEQRAKGWVDFHPEDFCHRCGNRNPVWYVDSDRWNLAVDHLDRGNLTVLDPACFIELWEAKTGLKAAWDLTPRNIRHGSYG